MGEDLTSFFKQMQQNEAVEHARCRTHAHLDNEKHEKRPQENYHNGHGTKNKILFW